MTNKFEKEGVPKEMREKFKSEITSRIISEGVPEVLRICKDKGGIDDSDVGQAIGWMLYGKEGHDGYENSEFLGGILGFKDYQDREAFFDHIKNIVTRKARELKGTYGEALVIDEISEVTGRKLFRGERNMLRLLMGEVFTALQKRRLTTEDHDFRDVSSKFINIILDKYKVEKVTDVSGREQFRKELTAVVYKSFTPEALAEYEKKKKKK
jgi:hypothetical protein